MITNWKNTHCCNQLRWAVAALALSVVLAFNSSAQNQPQRKLKSPPPPSYDELLQRALGEKKAATNRPAGSPASLAAQTNSPAQLPAAPVVEANTLSPQLTAPLPSAATNDDVSKSADPASSATNAVTIAPAAPPPAVQTTPTPPAAPVNETAKPGGSKPKGPVYSPLPPDLAPTNGLQKARSSGASSVTPDANKAMEALDDKHLLAIGDRLSFRIVEDDENPKELVVTDSGDLEAPYLGRFPAVGKSCKELARALKVELEKDYYYQATVIVAVDLMAKSRGKVYLAGAVRLPGPQEIPSDEELTVSKAILRAGGFTDFADKKNVKVTRKPRDASTDQSFRVNVEVILEKGKSELDLPLLSGDSIFIDERTVRF